MKRTIIFLFTIALLSMSNTTFAIDDRELHEEARFIADKIAYQFGFDKSQLTDTYEINYDFLKAVYEMQDGLIAGDEKAIRRYYTLLDIRNTDLLWLMDHTRYASFVKMDDIFRPIYVEDGQIRLRVYDTYDRNKFIGGKPKQYGKYNGEHARDRHNSDSYYKGRYRFIYYGEQPRFLDVRNKMKLQDARRIDFGK